MAEPVGDLVVDLSLDAARFDEQMARVRRHFSGTESDAKKTAAVVEQSINRQALAAQKAGISVGQYKAAMRTLPAQFTDIATQLAGGQNPWLILLLINLFLLFLGTFMESVAAITIAAPILFPIALSIGLNPVQFGVIFVLNLMIGVLTPPMAVVLFITSKIGEISFERAFKAVLPYYVALLLVLVLVNLFPVLTLGLPDLMLGGYK